VSYLLSITLKEDEGVESDCLMEFSAMKGIGDEKGELGLGMRRGGWVLQTGKMMGNELGAKLLNILVAVKRVWLRAFRVRRGVRILQEAK